LNKEIIQQAISHAKDEYPRESCGVVIVFKGREKYYPCRNISLEPENSFELHPEDYSQACDLGEITKIVHSHPKNFALPSEWDMNSIEKGNVPWIIVQPQTESFTETYPSKYIPSLIGREYVWGISDCYSIVRDYYKKELSISLPNYERRGEKLSPSENPFIISYKKLGFVKVEEPKKHDIILMFLNGSNPQHVAIYLGEGIMLHQVEGRLSSKDVYGNAGYWWKNTQGFYRHIDLV